MNIFWYRFSDRDAPVDGTNVREFRCLVYFFSLAELSNPLKTQFEYKHFHGLRISSAVQQRSKQQQTFRLVSFIHLKFPHRVIDLSFSFGLQVIECM